MPRKTAVNFALPLAPWKRPVPPVKVNVPVADMKPFTFGTVSVRGSQDGTAVHGPRYVDGLLKRKGKSAQRRKAVTVALNGERQGRPTAKAYPSCIRAGRSRHGKGSLDGDTIVGARCRGQQG